MHLFVKARGWELTLALAGLARFRPALTATTTAAAAARQRQQRQLQLGGQPWLLQVGPSSL